MYNFHIISLLELLVAMVTSFKPHRARNLIQPFTSPVMLHMKFDQDCPTGFGDILVLNCGWMTEGDDRRQQ